MQLERRDKTWWVRASAITPTIHMIIVSGVPGDIHAPHHTVRTRGQLEFVSFCVFHICLACVMGTEEVIGKLGTVKQLKVSGFASTFAEVCCGTAESRAERCKRMFDSE